MSIIGETILAASLEVLFEKLTSTDLLQFATQEQIQADLKKWERILKKIHAVIDDADEKQMSNQSVKLWIAELKNLAYDVEDILDEFSTEALRRQLLDEPQRQAQAQPQVSSKLRKLIPSCCTGLDPRSLKFNSAMRSQIDEITSRLQDLATEKEQLDLKESSNSGGRLKKVEERLPTTSLVNEAEVRGRDEDKKAIVDMLLNDGLIIADGVDGVCVIPIVGMGGLGKTTLAQLVYNDKEVESHFDLKAWACVSENFDAIKITKEILKSIRVQTDGDDTLNSLQVKLRDGLLMKKFLLVLDDMWSESYGDWTCLRLPFLAGAPGSKIIVTTRNQGVASMMGTVPNYDLKKLSDNDCRIVFTWHSLGTKDFSKHQHLQEIGEEILKKCNGLPLAAKTLGGLLRGKNDPFDWKKVMDNKIWNLPEEGNDIMRALKVSYYYLPPRLKRCFAYCSLLNEDFHFQEESMVLLWMAEGLLEPDTSDMKMEDVGRNYFRELHSRSFFQQSSQENRFVMHDLIADLAQWAAAELFLRLEDNLEANKQQTFSKNLRHFSYRAGYLDHMKRFEAISDCKHLRTFLPKFSRSRHFLSDSVVHMSLKFRRLRFLCMGYFNIYKISSSIGDLKHLRCLHLCGTFIETLPDSINTLYNLLTLLVNDCCRMKKLCADMGNLIKLRHLYNDNVPLLEAMPLGIGKLSCLQTLNYFVVGKDIGSRLKELKYLKNLVGRFRISRLENVKVDDDARDAELNGKRNIHILFLEWTDTSGSSREPETETRVLDLLRPHENLQMLSIRGYGGTKFPIWLEDSAFSNLEDLKFENCDVCTSLPSIGQLPALKQLSIRGMTSVRCVDLQFYGNSGSMSFPALETLFFGDMPEWEDWIPHQSSQGVEVFPQLRELSLMRCPKLLGRLPERLPLLESLVIQECECLLVSIPSTPTLSKLLIGGCKELLWRGTDVGSPNSMVSSTTPNQVFLTRQLKQELPNLEQLGIWNTKELTCLWQSGNGLLQDVSSLNILEIANCPQLVSLVAEEEADQQQQGLPCRLHYLELRSCPNLVKLPQALLSLSSLRQLKISECHSMESLPQALMHNGNAPLESLNVFYCNSLKYIARVQLPLRLKLLHVQSCHELRTLTDEDQISGRKDKGISSSSSRDTCLLEHLHIEDCPSLTSLFSKNKLPVTIEDIKVKNCSKLRFLSTRGALPMALKDLYIYECSELESIAEGLDRNSSLETIYIWGCPILKALPDNLHKGCQLRELTIAGCVNLVSFPDGGLASDKLTKLVIWRCEKLKAIPNCLHHFTSLYRLEILGCPSLGSFAADCFPNNLTALGIDYLTIHKPFLEWGLHRFNSLREFRLFGGSAHVVSFAPKVTGMVLPSSLTSMCIDNFPNLRRLSLIQSLTSLKSLFLYDCPNLEYFPENGLPPSLLRLEIIRCPLIKEKFKRDKGQYWRLIADLPLVIIDSKCPFDPDY